jgi:5-methylcytosine-specific restriction endonuclease McrA
MNVGEMQRKLNLKAVDDSNHRFDDLYSLLYAEGWLENAYDHIRRNRGSRTAGADGVTKGNFEEARDQNLAHLKKELQSQWECQVDHIVRRSTFKRPRDADALDNLQVLCTPCHRKKTTKGL